MDFDSMIIPKNANYHLTSIQVIWFSLTQDVIEVTDILTRHLYLHGDQLLEEGTPISLSVNEMYAITKRLLFPRDAAGDGE